MHIVIVSSHIKEEMIESFGEISRQNAEASRGEEGCVRFDILQQADDPGRFVFIEMFKSEADALTHRESIHFKTWLQAADPMMVAPRSRTIYRDFSLTKNEGGIMPVL